MTPSEYQEKATRTLSKNQQFWLKESKEEKEESRRLLLLNTALGMAGEAAEVSDQQTTNEFGDAYWYAYMFMKGIGIPPMPPMPAPDETKRAKEASPAELLLHAGVICELVKKYVFHGRSFEELLPKWTEAVMEYVNVIATLDPVGYEATFAHNIAKLEKRYPEGFRTANDED